MELKLINLYYLLVYSQLLIVPYGIETTKKNIANGVTGTFNRTLWN